VDAGMEADTALRTEYDPLLAKLMVHADDRGAAVARLRRALDETMIGGLQTDAGFLRWLVDEPSFVAGDYDTGFIDRLWRNGPALSTEEREMAAAAAVAARDGSDPVRPRTWRPGPSAWGQLARREGLRG
jgi:acetyl-CoA/propionyl-CoA carboxylase biotin carboxyl carrier protein